MTWTSWGESYVNKARITHICTWCGELIEKGSPYYRWRSKRGSDDPLTSRMHLECVDAFEEWSSDVATSGDEYFPGEFRRGCICSRDDDPCEVCVAKGVTE